MSLHREYPQLRNIGLMLVWSYCILPDGELPSVPRSLLYLPAALAEQRLLSMSGYPARGIDLPVAQSLPPEW